MVGAKIRQLRIQLGLSQQQLARPTFTRAYISQVENGKCQPSLEALRIIAGRLGKSVDYFIQEDDTGLQAGETVSDLLTLAQQDLESGNLDQAQRRTQQALSWTQKTDRPDLEAQARILMAKLYRIKGLLDAAVEECELASEACRKLNARAPMAEALMEWANCLYVREDYSGARRQYEKALHWAQDIKSLTAIRAKVYNYLGSTLYRLGEHHQSLSHYKLALKECHPQSDPDTWGSAAMGLGWIYHVTGDREQAMFWTRTAVNHMQTTKSPLLVRVQHNLAIIHIDRGDLESGYALLRDCLQTWRSQNNARQQASVLEDMANYWQIKGNLSMAEQCCNEALSLLEHEKSGVLRGRLYRRLARIEAEKGNLARAQDCLRFSLELLRYLNAETEIKQTMEELNRLVKAKRG